MTELIKLDGEYDYRNGEPAKVLCVDRKDKTHPVISIDEDGTINTHTKDGKYLVAEVASKFDLIPRSKYKDFKTDDKVLVRDYECHEWKKAYFSHEKDGKPYCFVVGRTEWSSHKKDETVTWNFCKKWTGE